MKVLVVFYSRTGITRKLARRIAAAMNAEIEEITDRVNRRGILGYLRSGSEGWLSARRNPSRGQGSARARSGDYRYADLAHVGGESRTRVFARSCGGAATGRVFLHVRQHGQPIRSSRNGGSCAARRRWQRSALSERQLASTEFAAAVEAFAARLRAASLPEPQPASQ